MERKIEVNKFNAEQVTYVERRGACIMRKMIFPMFFIAMILYGCGTAGMTKTVEPTDPKI